MLGRVGRARGGDATPGPPSQPELAADAAGAPAAERADELAGVEAEALEDARVLVRVDLIGQFAVGLRGLVLLAARAQQLEDLLLGYLHAIGVPAGAATDARPRPFDDAGGARRLLSAPRGSPAAA